jgi:hypothetical protein
MELHFAFPQPLCFHTVHRQDLYHFFISIFTQFLRLHIFHFLPPRFKPTLPQRRGVIPRKYQTGVITYQFSVWPRNDVQMFKFTHKSGTLWLCRHPPYRPTHSLIFLTVTQTNVSVKDAAEKRDCVAWRLVIVWVCSNCERMLTG